MAERGEEPGRGMRSGRAHTAAPMSLAFGRRAPSLWAFFGSRLAMFTTQPCVAGIFNFYFHFIFIFSKLSNKRGLWALT